MTTLKYIVHADPLLNVPSHKSLNYTELLCNSSLITAYLCPSFDTKHEPPFRLSNAFDIFVWRGSGYSLHWPTSSCHCQTMCSLDIRLSAEYEKKMSSMCYFGHELNIVSFETSSNMYSSRQGRTIIIIVLVGFD